MALVLYNRIGQVLTQKGWEQKDLAERTGLTPNTISEMVRNVRSTINREQFGKVAAALGVTDPSELLYFAVAKDLPLEEGYCLNCQQPVLPEYKLCTSCDPNFS